MKLFNLDWFYLIIQNLDMINDIQLNYTAEDPLAKSIEIAEEILKAVDLLSGMPWKYINISIGTSRSQNGES